MFNIFKRDLSNVILNPALNLYGTFFPTLLIITLSVINRSTFEHAFITSYDYYTVTLLVFIMFNMAVISTNSFMEVSIKQANLRIVYAPISRFEIYFSKILATSVFSLIAIVIALVVMQIAYGVWFGMSTVWLIIILFKTAFFASCLGVMVVILLKHEETANQLLGIFLIVLAMMGGVFFSPYVIGETFGRISMISPFRWVIESVFLALYDGHYLMLGVTFSILFVLSVICIVICHKFFKLEAYL